MQEEKKKTKSKKKRRGKDDVAIEIDTHQLDRLASLPTPPTAEDTDPDAQPALSDETAVVDDTDPEFGRVRAILAKAEDAEPAANVDVANLQP